MGGERKRGIRRAWKLRRHRGECQLKGARGKKAAGARLTRSLSVLFLDPSDLTDIAGLICSTATPSVQTSTSLAVPSSFVTWIISLSISLSSSASDSTNASLNPAVILATGSAAISSRVTEPFLRSDLILLSSDSGSRDENVEADGALSSGDGDGVTKEIVLRMVGSEGRRPDS